EPHEQEARDEEEEAEQNEGHERDEEVRDEQLRTDAPEQPAQYGPGETEGEEDGEGEKDDVGQDGHDPGQEGQERAQDAQRERAQEDAAGPTLDEEGLCPLGEPSSRRRAGRGKEYAPGHFRDSSRAMSKAQTGPRDVPFSSRSRRCNATSAAL